MIHSSLDKIYKKYKLVHDQEGIMRRFIREQDNWSSHLNFTKKFILENLPNEVKSIAVLGSGWLLDFPFNELAEKNINIDLFDLNHPKQILNLVRKYNNVECKILDLSGNLIHFINNLRKAKREIQQSEIEEYLSNNSLDFSSYSMVISLNLLSQIGSLIADNVLKKINYNFSKEAFIGIVQRTHLNMLPLSRSLLISDFYEIYKDSNNIKKGEKKLVFIDIENKEKYREWIWLFDTQKKYHNNYQTHMKVRAYSL